KLHQAAEPKCPRRHTHVYITVFAWYFVDPFINPEQYDYLPSFLLDQSYGQVLLFLIGFRLFAPVAMRWIVRRRSSGVFDTRLTPEQILVGAGALWPVLFVIGIARMGGDVMGAVFPLDGRGGATMWGRGAVESSASGFLTSFAGYLFNAVTAFLGVLVFFQRSTARRLLAAAMFGITLPYFFLAGARSHFLAAVLPFIITYLFYGRHHLILRLAILAIAFFCLNEGFKFVTAFRDSGGYREVLASENPYELMDEDMRPSGLNMIQELCFVNVYLGTGGGSPAYGARYLNELLNFVPRMIWPSKPLIGIDYAKWRGFESDTSELGVNTTVSSGMIGGGVLNFGQIFGPVAAGILVALWTGLLIRWWEQRKSLLRLVLFMLGVGLTFNLGRDISLLVLWPVVFAYFFVRLAEIWATKRFQQLPQVATIAPANPVPVHVVAGRLSQ
ncbi:MAG TPA: O-antigen polymerase, partial [Candidatus Acidoferrum sp.]|nr:O-antigen polymerase [Candidatus Acidoferrum sp.]